MENIVFNLGRADNVPQGNFVISFKSGNNLLVKADPAKLADVIKGALTEIPDAWEFVEGFYVNDLDLEKARAAVSSIKGLFMARMQ